MAQRQERREAKEIGKRTGRDPVILAAVGSVMLAWYQYYIRGNKHHGLFIGLWPPTLLAFSNAVRINKISTEVESKASNLIDWFIENR